jgi:hypothetical protein
MSEYDTDILAWSEHQAAVPRRRAAGELINDAELDWPNIAEEIEDVRRNELRSCRSLLRQALRWMPASAGMTVEARSAGPLG